MLSSIGGTIATGQTVAYTLYAQIRSETADRFEPDRVVGPD
jgi:hypothetical protein